jgi:hypothetical protein
MSAAAGAPPPPPPPNGHFNSLPAELLLEIIQYLQINDYVQFALAIYATLQRHGLVPPLTLEIYTRVTNQSLVVSRAYGPEHISLSPGERGQPSGKTPVPLPTELNNQIMDHLEPADRIAWLFSSTRMAGYFPDISEGTRRQLMVALRHARDAQQGPKK